MGSFNIDVYDDWRTTDVVGQLAWDEIYLQEWAESLIRQENPHLSEDDITILAEHRLETGYYANYDF
jgi:hypothetical protein